jgi:hypothetical protein
MEYPHESNENTFISVTRSSSPTTPRTTPCPNDKQTRRRRKTPFRSSVFSQKHDSQAFFSVPLKPSVFRINGSDDNFVSYRTSKYKLHYYETPTLLKFILITDAKSENKRVVLHQIYVSLYVEFVVKNPLREIDGPVGVETFQLALDQFVRTLMYYDTIRKSS